MYIDVDFCKAPLTRSEGALAVYTSYRKRWLKTLHCKNSLAHSVHSMHRCNEIYIMSDVVHLSLIR